MIDEIKKQVFELLKLDNSGHGYDHVMRVYDLAIRFADREQADKEIIGLAALLHDVDDYKLFGKENSKQLLNAKMIMGKANINFENQTKVLNIIKTMGYSNYLNGIRPTTLEGKIISDADMCDAMGASGIIRTIMYSISNKGNRVIFDRNIYPNNNISQKEYASGKADSTINHFFDKLLKLGTIMMTESGKQEANKRETIMVDFLRHYFEEENATEWLKYLDDYLASLKKSS